MIANYNCLSTQVKISQCENNYKMEIEDTNVDDNIVVIVLESSEDEVDIYSAPNNPNKEEDFKVEYGVEVSEHPIGYLNSNKSIPIYSKTNPSLP